MKPLLFLLFTAGALAQSLDLTVAPAVVPAGGIVTVTVNFTDSATPSGIACLQATLPAGFTGSPAPGSSATAGQKGLYFAPNGILIVCGADQQGLPLNSNALASGPLFTFVFTAPQATGQTVSVGLSGIAAVTGADTAPPVLVTSSPATFKTRSRYDVNGDGVVDQLDVDIVRQQVNGTQPCTTGDVDGDGVCKVKDLQLTIKAAQGKIGG